MNDTKALDEIHRLAKLGRIALTDHALLRMHERRASPRDVRMALVSATTAKVRIAADGGSRAVGIAMAMI